MNNFYENYSYKKDTWTCNYIKLFWGLIKIHWHYGPNQWHSKPLFRLRAIFINKWKLPLKYWDV